jgi:DNA-binding NtrC family response regulator
MREGLIEQANGGTLFLDEIGELLYSTQKLFLRERLEDIGELVAYKLKSNYDLLGNNKIEVSPEYIDALKSYSWPGNVRELFNAVERTLIVAKHSSALFPRDLPDNIRIKLYQSHKEENINSHATRKSCMEDLQMVRDQALSKIEKDYLQDLKEFATCVLEKACQISGLAITALMLLCRSMVFNLNSYERALSPAGNLIISMPHLWKRTCVFAQAYIHTVWADTQVCPYFSMIIRHTATISFPFSRGNYTKRRPAAALQSIRQPPFSAIQEG